MARGPCGAHEGNLGGRPGEVGVRWNVFWGQDAVSPAVGFARDHGDFRNGGFGEGEEKLRAMPDDAAEFLLRAGKKPRNILKGDQWNIEGVAEAHEACSLH